MDTKEGAKKKIKKTRPERAVSLDQFSLKEQALITLGADNKKQTIPDFMAEAVRFFIREMLEVRFKTDKTPLDT